MLLEIYLLRVFLFLPISSSTAIKHLHEKLISRWIYPLQFVLQCRQETRVCLELGKRPSDISPPSPLSLTLRT